MHVRSVDPWIDGTMFGFPGPSRRAGPLPRLSQDPGGHHTTIRPVRGGQTRAADLLPEKRHLNTVPGSRNGRLIIMISFYTAYATDEDIALRASADYSILCPRDQKLGWGNDGVFYP